MIRPIGRRILCLAVIAFGSAGPGCEKSPTGSVADDAAVDGDVANAALDGEDGLSGSDLPPDSLGEDLMSEDSTDTADGGDKPERICAADSPCFGYPYVCMSSTTYAVGVDHDCHFTCGPGACMGGTCDPTGPVLSCPAGTQCVRRYEWNSKDGQPPCAPSDGGVAD